MPENLDFALETCEYNLFSIQEYLLKKYILSNDFWTSGYGNIPLSDVVNEYLLLIYLIKNITITNWNARYGFDIGLKFGEFLIHDHKLVGFENQKQLEKAVKYLVLRGIIESRKERRFSRSKYHIVVFKAFLEIARGE